MFPGKARRSRQRCSIGIELILGVGSRVPGLNPTTLSCGTLLLSSKGPGAQRGILLPLKDDELRLRSRHQSQARCPASQAGVMEFVGGVAVLWQWIMGEGKEKEEKKGYDSSVWSPGPGVRRQRPHPGQVTLS